MQNGPAGAGPFAAAGVTMRGSGLVVAGDRLAGIDRAVLHPGKRRVDLGLDLGADAAPRSRGTATSADAVVCRASETAVPPTSVPAAIAWIAAGDGVDELLLGARDDARWPARQGDPLVDVDADAEISAAQAASRTPLPVLPATWKRTSALWPDESAWPNALPPAGSLNASEMSLVTYATLTLMSGLTDLAPFVALDVADDGAGRVVPPMAPITSVLSATPRRCRRGSRPGPRRRSRPGSSAAGSSASPLQANVVVALPVRRCRRPGRRR